MLETRNGIQGKVCSTCRQWKPQDDFPTTHSPAFPAEDIPVPECHRKAAEKRSVARKIARTLSVLVVLVLLGFPLPRKISRPTKSAS